VSALFLVVDIISSACDYDTVLFFKKSIVRSLSSCLGGLLWCDVIVQ